MKATDNLKDIARDAREVIDVYAPLATATNHVELFVLWNARKALALVADTKLTRETRLARGRNYVEEAVETAWDLRLPGCGR